MLRLNYEQQRSQREISRSVGKILGVSHYLKRVQDAQKGCPIAEGLSDQELYKKLYLKDLKITQKRRVKGLECSFFNLLLMILP